MARIGGQVITEAELRERYPVVVLLDFPAGRKVDQPRLGTTLVGGPSSPVVVSAFIDFNCPHCAALHEALGRLASSALTAPVAFSTVMDGRPEDMFDSPEGGS
ncbi:MAG: hypothetical protein Kow001_03440 [Acidobacteriota bacterium]